jgi:hypothetical protein
MHLKPNAPEKGPALVAPVVTESARSPVRAVADHE